MIPSLTRPRPRLRLPLQHILAMVAGYGMAALLFRAFWPTRRPSPFLMLAGIVLYLWLGLAMSGPIILSRRGPRTRAGSGNPGDTHPIAARTWAELAWMLIGIYWIVLGVVVIPARLSAFTLVDMTWFGLVPIVLALGFRLFGPRPSPARDAATAWTHPAAVTLLIAWPFAWACLIVLGTRLHWN